MDDKIKKAAQTIGLDLVEVKPMNFPRIDMDWLYFKYNTEFEKKSDKPRGQIFSDNDPYGEEIWE